MSAILEKIESNTEYFRPQKGGDWVEAFDDETKDFTKMPASCAFNCLVLALKETGHTGHVSIVHKRDALIRADGREEVYYKEYALLEDGYVHMVDLHGSYRAYGEREIA